jgi:DNA polymerase III subunit gamma/tau
MAYRALYRAYRPEIFADVIGQDHIINVLKNQIKNNKIAHAYLFSGPRGTGKTSTAKIFSKAINCLSDNGVEPCLKCAVCESVLKETCVDVIEIDAASNNGVENIRDIREKVSLLPAMGKYKVYIIDEVHMLSQGAFNALLKTLEEPPAHVIFILATTEPKKLPATILSRCQKYDFKRHSVSDMVLRLKFVSTDQGIKASDDALKLIARAASGGMRDSLSILDQCTSGKDMLDAAGVLNVLGGAGRSELLSLVKSITSYDERNAILKLESIKDSGADIKVLLKDLAYIFKGMLFLVKGADALSSGVLDEEAEELKIMGENFGENSLLRALEILIENEGMMRMNSLPDIVLQSAVIKLMCPNVDEAATDVQRIEKLEAKVNELKKNGITDKHTKEKKETIEEKKVIATQQKKEQAKPVKRTVKSADENKESTVDENNVEAWKRVLKEVNDKAGYLYPHVKNLKMINDKNETYTFEVEEGLSYDFLIDKNNHKKVEEFMKHIFNKNLSLIIKSVKKSDKEKDVIFFSEDMFGSQNIKEI